MNPISARIGWSRGASTVSRAIQKLDDSYWNHVYFRFNFADDALIYESHLKGGVQLTPLHHLLTAMATGKVLVHYEQDLELTPAQAKLLWEDCLPFHGDSYDTARILGYFLWIKLRKGKGKPRLHMKDRFTCNEFCVAAGRQMIDKLHDVDFSYTPERLFRLFHGGTHSKTLFGPDGAVSRP